MPWQRVPRRPGRRRNGGPCALAGCATEWSHGWDDRTYLLCGAGLAWWAKPQPQGWAGRLVPLVEEPPSWLGRRRAASRRRCAARHLAIRHWVCSRFCLVGRAGQSARLPKQSGCTLLCLLGAARPTLWTPIAHSARQSHLSPITHQRGASGGVGGASGRDLCTSPYQPPLTAPGGETRTALVRRWSGGCSRLQVRGDPCRRDAAHAVGSATRLGGNLVPLRRPQTLSDSVQRLGRPPGAAERGIWGWQWQWQMRVANFSSPRPPRPDRARAAASAVTLSHEPTAHGGGGRAAGHPR